MITFIPIHAFPQRNKNRIIFWQRAAAYNPQHDTAVVTGECFGLIPMQPANKV